MDRLKKETYLRTTEVQWQPEKMDKNYNEGYLTVLNQDPQIFLTPELRIPTIKRLRQYMTV